MAKCYHKRSEAVWFFFSFYFLPFTSSENRDVFGVMFWEKKRDVLGKKRDVLEKKRDVSSMMF